MSRKTKSNVPAPTTTTNGAAPADFKAHRAKRKAKGAAAVIEHGAPAEPIALPPPVIIDATPEAPEEAQVQLGPLSFVRVHASVLAAAVSVASKDGKRRELESVYIEQLEDGDVRIIASDGHRMLVQTYGNEPAPWARAGIMIPREQLEQVLKFAGKKEETVAIGFGEHHDKLTIESSFGTFKFAPVKGKFVDYHQVMQQAGALFASERETLDATAVNPKHLKAAGAIGAQLGSDGVQTFVGAGSELIVFTFAKVPGAILVQMGLNTAGAPALSGSVAKLIGDKALKGTLAALKAHATRHTKAAKGEKNAAKKAEHEAAAERLGKRIAEIMSGLAPQLEAPKAANGSTAA